MLLCFRYPKLYFICVSVYENTNHDLFAVETTRNMLLIKKVSD